MMEDGYYIPKDPEAYARWKENVEFDEEAYLVERRKTIMTTEELQKYNEVLTVVKTLSTMLKTTPEMLSEKVNSIMQETQDMTQEIRSLKIRHE